MSTHDDEIQNDVLGEQGDLDCIERAAQIFARVPDPALSVLPAPESPFPREQPSVSSTGGAKNVKPEKFSLIPTQALAKVAEHYGVGAEKYAAHQWRQGYEWSKSYDALQRHANAFWAGEDNDPETRTPHMAAVAFHALTLLTFMDEHPNHDDRYKEQS